MWQRCESTGLAALDSIQRPLGRGGGTYIVECDQRGCPASSVVTDGVEDAVAPDCGDQLLDEQCQEYSTDEGQGQVVYHEQSVELERLSVLHEFSPRENRHVVCYQHSRCCLQCGERCRPWYEDELVGREAHDLGVGRVEEGP